MNNIKNEIWKDIEGYDGEYQISNYGRVRSFKNKNIKILKEYLTPSNYRFVKLYKDGKQKGHLLHRLVAQAFISNPDNKPFVNHIDGNQLNCSISNLEWCSHQENVQHAYKTGLTKGRIKTINQYNLDGNFIRSWESGVKIQNNLNINRGHISQCCNGQRKTAGGYIWKFDKEMIKC